jgi:hypothetical protein
MICLNLSDHEALDSDISYVHSEDFNLLTYTPITSKRIPKFWFPDIYPQHNGTSSCYTPNTKSLPQQASSPNEHSVFLQVENVRTQSCFT